MNKYADQWFKDLGKTLSLSGAAPGVNLPTPSFSLDNALPKMDLSPSSLPINNVTYPGNFFLDKVKSYIKQLLQFSPSNIAHTAPIGAGAGILLGGAAGAITDPGVDEEGNRKSRLNRALGGAAIGGALGGTAGALTPLAMREGVKQLGKMKERRGDFGPQKSNIAGQNILVPQNPEGVTSARTTPIFKNEYTDSFQTRPTQKFIAQLKPPTETEVANRWTNNRLDRVNNMSAMDIINLLLSKIK